MSRLIVLKSRIIVFKLTILFGLFESSFKLTDFNLSSGFSLDNFFVGTFSLLRLNANKSLLINSLLFVHGAFMDFRQALLFRLYDIFQLYVELIL